MPQLIQKCQYCDLEWTAEDVEDILFCRESEVKCGFYERRIKTAISLPARREAIPVANKRNSLFTYISALLLLGLVALSFFLFQAIGEKEILENRLILNEKEKGKLQDIVDQNSAEPVISDEETAKLYTTLQEQDDEIEELKQSNRQLNKELKSTQATSAPPSTTAPSTFVPPPTPNNLPPEPLFRPAEQVVINFFEYLNRQRFQEAYQLQSIASWGDAAFFASKKSFGGVTKTEIFETQVRGEDDNSAKIFVHYFSEDPTNDPSTKERIGLDCKRGGLYYEQLFKLRKNNGVWKIVETKLLNRWCGVNAD